MPSLNRRVAARRLAWGRGPHVLAFTAPTPRILPTHAPQAEAEVVPALEPEPDSPPSLVLRFMDECMDSPLDSGDGHPSLDPSRQPAPLAVIHADGSRDRLELEPEMESVAVDAWSSSSGRSWVRLRPQESHLRVYAGEVPALALRQA